MSEDWSTEDIEYLHDNVRCHTPLNKIAAHVGRSKNAVLGAMKKIMFQQLLNHDVADVAANYGMTVDDLHNTIVNPKYYVPIQDQTTILQNIDVPTAAVWVAFGMLCSAGLFRFGMVLHEHMM
jgi:hypothetical protein